MRSYYFHNYAKILFDFFTVLTFALMVDKTAGGLS